MFSTAVPGRSAGGRRVATATSSTIRRRRPRAGRRRHRQRRGECRFHARGQHRAPDAHRHGRARPRQRSSPIVGNDGANVLEGLTGDDTLYGGAGADAMHGGDGEDGYVYALGDGDDTLADSGGEGETDTLVLTGGIGPGDVAVHRLAATPDDVVLTFAQGGRVVLTGFMASPGAGIDAVPSTTARSGRAPSCSRKRTPPRCSTTSRRRRSTIPTSSPSGRRRSSRPRRCSPTIATSRVTR